MALSIKKTAHLLKKQLDPLMVGLQTSQPDFVAVYTLLRHIKKKGRTTLSVITSLIDATTLLPIEGAKLELLKTTIKRVSSATGTNRIKNVLEGQHELKVSHKDYKETVVQFISVKGITKKLTIKLEALD